jgi:lipopolysaccharide transport system ATP-binding protein
MSCETAIAVRNISKCYEIYAQPHHRLFQTLLRGKKQFYREFWALRDVSFDLKKGECIGIIGRNGSGKSTLLQVIAGTLRPTAGSVDIKGRVAALLELGSGFNPEFTGRENIYMNGTVLGLSSREINERFADIEEFADIGEFIDQPVKTYSSGMLVRLAFAVQTQVEPDILIVDEALAVGDAAFQMKCMARMNSLMERGVTILFVSHSVQMVRSFCSRAVWLDKGVVREIGQTPEVTSLYMEYLFSGKTTKNSSAARPEAGAAPVQAELLTFDSVKRTEPLRRWGEGGARIEKFFFSGSDSVFTNCVERLDRLTVRYSFTVFTPPPAEDIFFAFSMRDKRGIDIVAFSSHNENFGYSVKEEESRFIVEFQLDNILNPGEYMLLLGLEYFVDGKRKYSDFVENALMFTVVSDRKHFGVVEPKISFSIK